ncbi:selenium cofactor biosynthesis protein YqeC [Oxobacter pfennigii]|nr:selenium cofactor biosynthesis protein YqeC [Oxobacter pfennigii]
MDIKEAFDIKEKEVVSFVGAGGKTSLIKLLAEELKSEKARTVITTTTYMYAEKSVIADGSYDRLFLLLKSLPESIFPIMAGKEINNEGKLKGVSCDFIDRLNNSGHFTYILSECDGSKKKPFKAFAIHEPVVPECTSIYIAVAGLDCLNKPLNDDNVHRPKIICDIAERKMEELIDEDIYVSVFTHSEGLFRASRKGFKNITVLNKADTPSLVNIGINIGNKILDKNLVINSIVICGNYGEVRKVLRR